MEQDIFEKVGKRLPYRTPDGYFEASENQIKTSLRTGHYPIAQNHSADVVNNTSQLRILSRSFATAAAIALVIGLLGILRLALPIATPSDELLYSQSDDTYDDWSDFADADIFLDTMD